MARKVPNVREWSETVRPREFWVGNLDLYVLKQYDRILHALGRESTGRQSRSHFSAGRVAREGPAVLLVLASLSATAVFGGRARERPVVADPLRDEVAGPVAAGFFIIALLGVLAILYWWWRSGRRWRGTDMIALGVSIGAAAYTLFGMRNALGTAGLTPTLLPLWATMALAAAALLTMAVASRGPDAALKHFRLVATPDPQRARELIDVLNPGERDRLNGQRAHAIAKLRERGLLDVTDASDLESVPLGMSPTVGHDLSTR